MRLRLELSTWGDGTIRLSHWDSDQGHDKHFVLGEDGRAFVSVDGPDETETLKPVDLVLELRKMLVTN